MKIYIFHCTSSIDARELAQSCEGDELKTVCVPCSGRVNLPYLLKAFETGADGVILITWAEDEWRHLEGNLRARKRAQAVNSLLDEIGMGSTRLTVIQHSEGGTEQILREIVDFRTRIKDLPQPAGTT